MRIIYLHQYFRTREMSGGTRSFEIGRRLAAAGHRVEIVTSWQDPTRKKDWFTTSVEGMRVHWFPVPYSNHMGYRARINAFLKFARAAGSYAASLDGDVVLATSTPLTIAVPGAYVAKRNRIPMVFEVRDLWPEIPIALGALKHPLLRYLARQLESYAYRNAARVIALSPGMADGVARSGYPRDRIAVVPNGADLDIFRRDVDAGLQFRAEHGIHADKIVVGYCGTIGRINGVGYLVRLARELRADTRFQFLVVGDGQEGEHVAALAREQSVLGHNLTMLPSFPKLSMPTVLSAIDIATSLFLPIPQMEANSANKFFDGLAAGCCMAINHGGWQEELLRTSEAGIRLASEPAHAAAQLQELAASRNHITQMGRNARLLAETRFARDHLASEVESVLSTAVSTRL